MKAIKNIMIALSGIALLASCDMDKFFELDRPESNPWLSVDDLEYSVADPYNYNRQIKKFPTEKQNVSLKHILT